AMDRFGDTISADVASGVKRSKTATEALQFMFDFMIRLKVGEGLPSGCLMVNSAVELAARDADVDTKSTKSFALTEHQLKEIILQGQRDGEFTSNYDAEELAEYLHNVLVGIRVMARTSVTKEKLHRIASMSIKFLEK
ncbi:TetR family transcriptional regulator C-terminal domain-containing protein, partial [Priestia megaterium]